MSACNILSRRIYFNQFLNHLVHQAEFNFGILIINGIDGLEKSQTYPIMGMFQLFFSISFAWTSLISSNEDETRLASSNVQRFRSIVLPSVKDISAPVRFEEVNCTSYKRHFSSQSWTGHCLVTAPSPFWPQKSPTLVIAHYSFPSLLEWPPVDPLSKMRALPPAVYEMNQIHQRSIEGIHPIY